MGYAEPAKRGNQHQKVGQGSRLIEIEGMLDPYGRGRWMRWPSPVQEAFYEGPAKGNTMESYLV